MEKPIADRILEMMSYPDLEGPYVLGCFGTQITFRSQQCRAFNLIYALFETGKLKKGDSIAIVGGGVAGVTAAAAAASKGCRVTLFERDEELMRLQRGNTSRYVHPWITSWPFESLDKIATDFPFLNWVASETRDVIFQIERDWSEMIAIAPRRFGGSIEIRDRCRVETAGPRRLTWNKNAFEYQSFDRVVLAVGFGEEKSLAGEAFRSYWQDDSLHQGAGRSGDKPHYLVSGCGDGGLIEATRLCLKDYNHGQFLYHLAKRLDADPLRSDLRKVEVDSLDQQHDDVGIFQWTEYQRLKLGEGIATWLDDQVRKDVDVTLGGRGATPLGHRSSPINRLAVFLLMTEVKMIKYQQYSINVEVRPGGRRRVSFERNTARNVVAVFDEVIVRHGPEPIVGCFLEEDVLARLRSRNENDELTTHPHWDLSFYPELPSKQMTSAIAGSIRERHLIGQRNVDINFIRGFIRGFGARQRVRPAPDGRKIDDVIELKDTALRLEGMARAGDPLAKKAIERMAKTADPRAQEAIERTAQAEDPLATETIDSDGMTDFQEALDADCVRGLVDVAGVAFYKGDYDTAKARAEAALAIDPECVAALFHLGNVLYVEKNLDGAKEKFDKICDMSKDNPDRLSRALNNLGLVELEGNHLDEAARYFSEAMKQLEPGDRSVRMANPLSNLAFVKMEKGELDEARSDFEESLEIEKSLRNRVGVASDYYSIGQVYLKKAQLGRAEKRDRDQWLSDAKHKLVEAQETNGRLDWRLDAMILDGLGGWANQSGKTDAARRYWTQSRDLYRDLGLREDQAIIEKQLATLRPSGRDTRERRR
jgi:tetratricopeptide (TPR) repeat protein